MMQLRPYDEYNRLYKKNFMTYYENHSQYRCFRSVYTMKHTCSDSVPGVSGTHWQVRGDEFIFLYLMPWYFETPSQRWIAAFQDMGARYKYFLYHG